MATARFLHCMCFSLRASELWLHYATLEKMIPSFPWTAPPTLHPCARKEGIKFRHLATLPVIGLLSALALDVTDVQQAALWRAACDGGKEQEGGDEADSHFCSYTRGFRLERPCSTVL